MLRTTHTGYRLAGNYSSFASSSPFAVLCSSVASAVALATLVLFFFLFSPSSALASTVLNLSYPFSGDLQSATGGGLNGMVVTDTVGGFPLLAEAETLHSIKVYLKGTTLSNGLQLNLHNGSSLLDCSTAPALDGTDYNLSTSLYKDTEFVFSGTQCLMATGQRYEIRLTYGSGSGYAIATDAGFGVFVASNNGVYDEGFESSSAYNTIAIYDPIYNTRFLTASTSGTRLSPQFHVQYFLDPDEYTFNNSPDSVSISVWQDDTQDVFVGKSENLILSFLAGTSTRTFTFPYSLTANKNYRASIIFWNELQDRVTFERTYVNLRFSTDGTNITSYTIDNISNGLIYDINAYEECTLTNWSGCLNNSLRFLFVPDETVVSNITATYDNMWSRAPFIYLTQIDDIITALFPNTGDSFAMIVETGIGNMTLMSSEMMENMPLHDEIRFMIESGMWIAFAFLMYQKTNNIHKT